MNKINSKTYKYKLREIYRDKSDCKLLKDNCDFFNNNIMDLQIRHEKLYNKEIKPIMEEVKEILCAKRKELMDFLMGCDITEMKKGIVKAIKEYGWWRVEDLALCSDYIQEYYIKTLMDMESCYGNMRVIAVDPDKNERLYSSSYKASVDLGIHPHTVMCCCKGIKGHVSGKSKKDGKIYTFRFEVSQQQLLGKIMEKYEL